MAAETAEAAGAAGTARQAEASSNPRQQRQQEQQGQQGQQNSSGSRGSRDSKRHNKVYNSQVLQSGTEDCVKADCGGMTATQDTACTSWLHAAGSTEFVLLYVAEAAGKHIRNRCATIQKYQSC